MMRRVAILGFGRFGRAFSWLLEEAGLAVTAYDRYADVPSALRAASPEAAIAGVDLVMIAVPVMAVGEILEAIEPHLTPAQIVIDVASVKTHPEAALRSILGSRVPWVATHPLFGPASLARGERPMRAVVCKNELHPAAADAVSAFYRRIGCEVIEQSAEDHDRTMARTHVLTFFIAKGLLDTGADQDVPFAPPSFQALHRVLDAVRIDAGHLFYPIQHENPFAATERRRLIDALQNVDDQIASHVPAAQQQIAPLSIPDLGKPSGDLSDVRAQIDVVDRELFDLLRRRAQLAARAGQAKAREGKPVRDPDREHKLLEARATWAAEADLDAQAIRDVFEAILRHSRSVQRV